MRTHSLVLFTLMLGIAGCDRRAQQAQRLAEERAALEREKAQLAADRAAADRASTEEERARLDSERAALELERAKLSSDRNAQAKAEENARLAAEREKRLAAERRAAEESAARRQAELSAQEAQRAGERAAADAKATQTVDFFYDALDPHGDWVEIERYGYAFRPNLARNAQWRPYTDGSWIHTDYGWTWRSDEPFGWATYHYGRWTRVPRLGWVWIPGSEWGPAWVSWRRSDDYVGWAPLPPDAWSSSGFNAAVDSYFDIGPGSYVFVSVRDFAEPTYTGHVVQPEQNVTIINKTVNVTNVTYKTVNQQNIVVNNGPEIAFVEQRGGRPVQRAKVERMAMRTASEAQPAKLQGDVLRLAAPILAAKTTTGAKPKAVKEQVKAEEADRGWEKSDPQARAKIREQAQREARRAERRERGEAEPVGAPSGVDAPAKPEPPSPSAPRPRGGRTTPVAVPSERPVTPATPKPAALPPPTPASTASPTTPVPASKAIPTAETPPANPPPADAPPAAAATPEPKSPPNRKRILPRPRELNNATQPGSPTPPTRRFRDPTPQPEPSAGQ